MDPRPLHLDLVRDEALSITWDDGHSSRLPVALLRRMSPSADQRQLREEMASNPLTVLPSRTMITSPRVPVPLKVGLASSISVPI